MTATFIVQTMGTCIGRLETGETCTGRLLGEETSTGQEGEGTYTGLEEVETYTGPEEATYILAEPDEIVTASRRVFCTLSAERAIFAQI